MRHPLLALALSLSLALPAAAQTVEQGSALGTGPTGGTGVPTGPSQGVAVPGFAPAPGGLGAPTGTPEVDPGSITVVDEDFQLRPGDSISVSVLEDASLNRTLLVRPDGKVSMPIAGTIDASGRTPEEVEQIILRGLSEDFITAPTVDVSLAGLGPFNARIVQELLAEQDDVGQVFVLGEVARPGGFPFETGEPFNILQALALAGGPSVFAATRRIQLRRKIEGAAGALYLFDYDAVLDGAPLAEIVPVVDGDVIVVPERGLFE
ncbi:MAG: polysaccharide biosynthesis/export family protein [Paracoccaceae bacterium]